MLSLVVCSFFTAIYDSSRLKRPFHFPDLKDFSGC